MAVSVDDWQQPLGTSSTASVGLVRLDRVRPDRRYRLRADVGEDLAPLVASIRARGVVQPIVVQRGGDRFVIRQGHRRAAAAVLAGLELIPAVVHDRPLGEAAWLLQLAAESASVRVLGIADKRRLVTRLRELGCPWRRIAAAFGVTPKTAAVWVCDDDLDDRSRSVGFPRHRATRRLIATHREEFERFLLEERQAGLRGVAA